MIVERPALERRVLASLEAGRIPVLLGGCGIGRTSAAAAARAARRARSQPVPRHGGRGDHARALPAARCRPSSAFRRRRRSPRRRRAARAAFDGLLAFFDRAVAADGGPVTFLLDEFLDVRTFENFPGPAPRAARAGRAAGREPGALRARVALHARVHRLLRDAPARFEVMHVAAARRRGGRRRSRSRFDGGRRDWAADIAPAVTALTGGRARRTSTCCSKRSARWAPRPIRSRRWRRSSRPTARLTARCRESYEFRLHRARGYGALKAILGVLADGRAAQPDRDLAPPAPHAGLDEGLSLLARGRRPRHVAGQALRVRRSAAAALRAPLRAARAAERRRRSCARSATYAKARLPHDSREHAAVAAARGRQAAGGGRRAVGHHRDRLRSV